MKKFVPLLVIIIVLGAAALWFVLHKSSGTQDKEESAFAVENKNDIYKVRLTDSDRKILELTKQKGIWFVNGKFPARDELVQSVLEAITRVTTLCPVPNAAHDNVIREMLGKNIKVDVYAGKDDKPAKTYYVGGPTIQGDGTYMLLEKDGKMASRPFITYIPGVHGYLTPRFNTDEELWRSKDLFNYQNDEIKSISVEYPAEEQNSFIVNRIVGDSFTVSPKDEKYAINAPYTQNYLRQYTGFFSSVSVEAFDNNFPAKDSVLHTTPYCIITITEKDNSVNMVSLYYMAISKRSKVQYDIKGNELTYDLEHYHAAIHGNKDFAIIQYYVFGKLLRTYKDFFFKAPVLPAPRG
ncbi:MAG: hypothetical protein JWO06_3607 [Bacteroidota bacterium]|nr:hypothetical protein [Bacteroidota bacterium]